MELRGCGVRATASRGRAKHSFAFGFREFRVGGLGFRVYGFEVWGLGFAVLGFRVWVKATVLLSAFPLVLCLR